MIIKYEQSNLLERFENKEFDAIGHQANCFGLMGSGIARLLAKTYPEVEKVDAEAFANKHENLFGDFSVAESEFGQIYNLYGQYRPGGCIESQVDLNCFTLRLIALKKALIKMRDSREFKSIGFPLMASGIAADKKMKGDQTDLEYFQNYIEPIVKEVFTDTEIEITICYL